MERDAVKGPRVGVGRLKVYEICLLYRRRSGYTQTQVARKLKRCRWWINQMERGEAPCHELIDFWEC